MAAFSFRRHQAKNYSEIAREIWQKERKQAERISSGNTLRQQLKFTDYVAKRSADPRHTFRQHLKDIGGAIEE